MAEGKVRVQTSDGDVIEVDAGIAKQWGPIRSLYEIFNEMPSNDKPVVLESVNTLILNKILEWSTKHREDEVPAASGETRPKRLMVATEWDKKFLEVEQPVLFGIILAANYLDIQGLLDIACEHVASMIRNKTPEQVRATFNLPNDIPPLPSSQESVNNTASS